jgi:outer membrane lipoprotein carrier protein
MKIMHNSNSTLESRRYSILSPLLFLLAGGLVIACVNQAIAQVKDAFVCKGVYALENAKTLTEKMQKKYEAVPRLSALFSQESFLAALEASETSAGGVSFEKPGKMKWEYTTPSQQTFLVKDDALWFYQPEDNQIVIDSFDKVLISELPVAFLMGLGNLSRDFTISSACKTSEGVALTFHPSKGKEKKKNEGLSRLVLLTSEQNPLPQGAQVVDVGNNVTSILLTDITSHKEYAPDHFTVTYPSTVDVQDRRESKHGDFSAEK